MQREAIRRVASYMVADIRLLRRVCADEDREVCDHLAMLLGDEAGLCAVMRARGVEVSDESDPSDIEDGRPGAGCAGGPGDSGD